MKTRVIVAAMALFLTIGLSAQTPQKTNQENKKSCFVDKNNDGVCDKYEDGTCKTGNGKGLQNGTGKRQGQRDGSGRKKGKGTGQANGRKGANYVDANKNGICDRKENTDKK